MNNLINHSKEWNEKLAHDNFLSSFILHFRRVKHLTSVEDAISSLNRRECPFKCFRSHFKGDTVFREMRLYFAEHGTRRLKNEMISLLQMEAQNG